MSERTDGFDRRDRIGLRTAVSRRHAHSHQPASDQGVDDRRGQPPIGLGLIGVSLDQFSGLERSVNEGDRHPERIDAKSPSHIDASTAFIDESGWSIVAVRT